MLTEFLVGGTRIRVGRTEEVGDLFILVWEFTSEAGRLDEISFIGCRS